MKIIKLFLSVLVSFTTLYAMDSNFDFNIESNVIDDRVTVLTHEHIPNLDELYALVDCDDRGTISEITHLKRPLTRELEPSVLPVNTQEPVAKRNKPTLSAHVTSRTWEFKETAQSRKALEQLKASAPLTDGFNVYGGLSRRPEMRHISYAELAERDPKKIFWCPLCFDKLREPNLVKHVIYSACALNMQKRACQNCVLKARKSPYLFKAPYVPSCCALKNIKELIGEDKLYCYKPQKPQELLLALQNGAN